MGKNTFSLPSKVKIRKEWNLPIIDLITNHTRRKLIYLGLPSPAADDIDDWIDHIDKVIAFQCRKYPHASNSSQPTTEIEKLTAKLSSLERQGKISDFFVYDGYIEEVVLRGRDMMNNEFHQGDEVITLYNLDYCNSLSAPIEYIDSDGVVRNGYKFDTISKLMEFQKKVSINSKKFILFLTIKCDYYEPAMGALLTDGCERSLRDIHSQYSSIIDPVEKKAHLLRSYTIQNLKTYFAAHGFIPEFLPTINYNGKPMQGTPNGIVLLHFTVLGTQMQADTGIAPFYQSVEDLLQQKFIYIRDGEVVENPEKKVCQQ